MTRRTQANPKTLINDAREAVRDCPIMALRLAARMASAILDTKLRPIGVGVAQLGLMAQVAGATDDTIGALAARCGLDPSTLSRNLQALSRLGLVEVATVERDLRRRAVWLTELGARKLEQALPIWRKARRDVGRALNDQAATNILSALKAIEKPSGR